MDNQEEEDRNWIYVLLGVLIVLVLILVDYNYGYTVRYLIYKVQEVFRRAPKLKSIDEDFRL
jgi:hypothetical protein